MYYEIKDSGGLVAVKITVSEGEHLPKLNDKFTLINENLFISEITDLSLLKAELKRLDIPDKLSANPAKVHSKFFEPLTLEEQEQGIRFDLDEREIKF